MNYTSVTLLFFKFFGLHNLAVKRGRLHERFLIFWTWMQFVFLIGLSIGVIYYANRIVFIVDTLGTSADVIQIIAPFLTHYIIIAESLLTRQIRYQIVYQLEEVDKLFPRPLVLIAEQVHSQRYFRKLWMAQTLSLLFECLIINGISAIELWSRHWRISIFVVIVCRSQHLFYVYHVDSVKSRLKLIINELNSVCTIIRSGDATGAPLYSVYDRIQRSKYAYNRIWEMVQCIETAFGWSMFANIISNFICLTVNLYWNYASILYIESNPYWKESVMCSFPLIITFYVLFSSCNNCLQTVSDKLAINCCSNRVDSDCNLLFCFTYSSIINQWLKSSMSCGLCCIKSIRYN